MFIVEPLPMLMDGLFAWRFRIGNDFNKIFESHDDLHDKVNVIAQEMRIDKEILVKKSSSTTAHGNSLLPGMAGFLIDPSFASNIFVIKHELSHIKNNDNLIVPLISIIAGIIAGLAAARFFPQVIVGGFILSRLIGLITTWITLPLICQWRERIADETALGYCTKEEKQAGLDFMEEQRQLQIKYRDQKDGWICMLWKKLIISPEGNFRLDILHPSLSRRCEYIKASIEK